VEKKFRKCDDFADYHGLNRAQYREWEQGFPPSHKNIKKIIKEVHKTTYKEFFSEGFDECTPE